MKVALPIILQGEYDQLRWKKRFQWKNKICKSFTYFISYVGMQWDFFKKFLQQILKVSVNFHLWAFSCSRLVTQKQLQHKNNSDVQWILPFHSIWEHNEVSHCYCRYMLSSRAYVLILWYFACCRAKGERALCCCCRRQYISPNVLVIRYKN